MVNYKERVIPGSPESVAEESGVRTAWADRVQSEKDRWSAVLRLGYQEVWDRLRMVRIAMRPSEVGDMIGRRPSQVPCHLDQREWDTGFVHFDLVLHSDTEPGKVRNFEFGCGARQGAMLAEGRCWEWVVD